MDRMYDNESRAGALEGNVHIPRIFYGRDGALISAVAMVMLAVARILFIVSVGGPGSPRRFIAGLSGLLVYYVTLPVLFAGSYYLMKGRTKTAIASTATIITGFVLFLVLFFVMMFTAPVYYAYSIDHIRIPPLAQTLVLVQDGIFLTSMFMMLFPHAPDNKRRYVMWGFILVIIPLVCFSFMAMTSKGANSFFLSPIVRYFISAAFYTIGCIGLFWVFQGSREAEGHIEPFKFVTRGELPLTDGGAYEEVYNGSDDRAYNGTDDRAYGGAYEGADGRAYVEPYEGPEPAVKEGGYHHDIPRTEHPRGFPHGMDEGRVRFRERRRFADDPEDRKRSRVGSMFAMKEDRHRMTGRARVERERVRDDRTEWRDRPW